VKANRVKNLALITPTTLLVGVDGHQENNTAGFSLANGNEPVRPVKFGNNRRGFLELLEKTNRVMSRNGLDSVVFVLEPNGPYWQLLARFLSARDYVVKVVNPLQVKMNRQTGDPSPDKNDFRDARSAADLGRQGKFNQTALLDQRYEDLRMLAGLRDSLVEERSMHKHRLRCGLVRTFPELRRCTSDLFGKGMRALLQVAPSAEAVVWLGTEAVSEVLKSATRGRLGKKKAIQIVNAAKESVGYAEATCAVRLQVESILSVAELLSEKIEQIELEMERLVSDLDEAALILSIPGIGLVTAAAILGQIGGFSQYENPGQIRKLAGLDLVGSQSGNHQGKLAISKRGRKLLRKVLYQAAVSSLACNEVSIRFYNGLIESTRPNRLKKKQALVAVMGKLIEIMFALVRTGKPFEFEHEWTRPGQAPEDLAQAA